jgi:hydrogenase maturation protease
VSRVLIAGIGNIFMGDDGFGCEVARRLSRCDLPEGVDVVDFGIRGMDLSYALMDGYEAAILIDTARRGGPPGSVYVIEPEMPADDDREIAPHEMHPAKVLRFAASLGERRPRVLLVACEPESLGGTDGHMGLSGTATVAVEEAVAEVQRLVEGLRLNDLLEQRLAVASNVDRKGARAPGEFL